MFYCTHRLIGTLIVVCLLMSHNIAAQQAITLPFRLVDKLIVVEARVEGQTGFFILDTGIEQLVLNRQYFTGRPGSTQLVSPLGGSVRVEDHYTRLRMGDALFKDVYAQVVPLASLERAKDQVIHGLIGTRIFRDYELLVDLSARQLTLFPLDRQGESGYYYLTEPADTIAFRWKGFLPCLAARLGDQALDLILDTGAEISLIAHKQAQALRTHVQAQNRSTQLVSIGNGQESAEVNVLQSLHLDSWACPPLRLFFGSVKLYKRERYGPIVDGLIGYEALSPYQWAINFKKREIYVWLQDPTYRGVVASRFATLAR